MAAVNLTGAAWAQAATLPQEAAVASASPAASGAERGFFDPVPESERTWFDDCVYENRWLASQCRGFRAAWYDRRPLILVSGYSWHDPSTYDDEKLDSYNSAAWGGGFGFGRYDPETGDSYSWYALAFKDSNSNATIMAGFSWLTYWPDKADLAVGLGYTAFLMQRPDIFDGIPFPGALPLASLKIGNAEFLGTFIPKLNGGVNHGNVGYFFGRYQF